MNSRLRTTAFAVFLFASSAYAAPILDVGDIYAGNAWPVPACSNPPSGPCAPSVTFVPGTPSGWQLARSQTSVSANANGVTAATSFDNGVLTAFVEGTGPLRIEARSRFRETYTFAGPATPNFIVPFHIQRFALGTGSAGPTDLRWAQLRIDILVNNVSKASLN